MQLRELESSERIKQLEILLVCEVPGKEPLTWEQSTKRKMSEETKRSAQDIEKQLDSMREIDKVKNKQ